MAISLLHGPSLMAWCTVYLGFKFNIVKFPSRKGIVTRSFKPMWLEKMYPNPARLVNLNILSGYSPRRISLNFGRCCDMGMILVPHQILSPFLRDETVFSVELHFNFLKAVVVDTVSILSTSKQ